uniref:PKcGMP_CC domain-containing protein n=1 Tax=Anopheles merus TaxID=30066 RepID=A0A182VI28_ANOME
MVVVGVCGGQVPVAISSHCSLQVLSSGRGELLLLMVLKPVAPEVIGFVIVCRVGIGYRCCCSRVVAAKAKIVWMRVCFDGLCFASRRPAVEQETQTVLCGATALDAQQLGRLLKYTNFASPAAVPVSAAPRFGDVLLPSSVPAAKKTAASATAAATDASVSAHGFASSDRSVARSSSSSSRCEQSASVPRDRNDRDGKMSDQSASATAPVPSDASDTVNNNLDAGTVNSYKQLAQLQGDQQVEGILQNLFIGDGEALGLSPQVQELLKVVQAKDIRIRELEDMLRQKHDEVAELRSHLDKFQSVFRTSGGATGVSPGGRKLGTHGGVQRQRAQGISAEPQSESSVLELMHVTFPKYDKEERA